MPHTPIHDSCIHPHIVSPNKINS